MSLHHIAIVGASSAGLTVAETLRREGYQDRITIIGDETHPPYDRPPLSKDVLSGHWEPEQAHLRPQETLDGLQIEWLTGRQARRLDIASREIRLDDDSRVAYDGLAITTGVHPRRWPGTQGMAGVFTLRTIDDAIALREAMMSSGSIVIVGAGFLGAEVAAVARTLGLEVSLIDPLPQPMLRQFGPQMGRLLAGLHDRNGVRMLTSTGASEFLSRNGKVTGIRLNDGSTIATDVILVAIGSIPATEWLQDSGLNLANGVECDASLEAAPGVVAAGDVASWWHPIYRRRLRVEHRMNATEQGRAAARRLLGNGQPFAPIPFFWTDQYDVKVQAYGLPSEDAVVQVSVGSTDTNRFAMTYHIQGRLMAGIAYNMPREAIQLRHRIYREQFTDADNPGLGIASSANQPRI